MMPEPFRLALQLLDREPGSDMSPGMLTQQVWMGGATDLSSRTMIADPPRWLLLADHAADPGLMKTPGSLLAWDLEQITPGRLLSPADAGGVILVSMDIDPEHEAEFNDWYNTEHIPRLSAMLGVIAARRFRSRRVVPADAPAYVALYHVDNTDLYATEGWVAANQTPWMLRMRRFQRNRTYFMFRTRVR